VEQAESVESAGGAADDGGRTAWVQLPAFSFTLM